MAYNVDKHFKVLRMGQKTEKLKQGQDRGKEALCAILNDVQHCIHTTRQNLDLIGMKSHVLYSHCFLQVSRP